MKVGVIGAGYAGLVTAACLAEKGNDVVVVDKEEKKINSFLNGKVLFFEPGLEELVQKTISMGHLHVSKEISDAVKDSEIIFIAVGTPQGESNIVNTNYVTQAADSIGDSIKYTNDFKIIAVKSTVLPGTTKSLVKVIEKYRSIETFAVSSNPEFLKEGSAVKDFRIPDRVIIGSDNSKALHSLRQLYQPFMRTCDRIISMSIESAELTKYVSNAMLATRIALMNEAALIAERVDANIDEVRNGVGSDPRIGPKFLFPGPGYGGSCFPKDIAGLVEYSKMIGVDFSILEAVIKSNNRQRYWLADTVLKYYSNNVRDKKFALWGASFKPGTDDVRESPAIYTINRLLDYGAKVGIYDPEDKALDNLSLKFNDKISYYHNVYQALEEASALLIVTDWDEFKSIDIRKVKSMLRKPVIIDSRNLYPLDEMEKYNLDYISLGRRKILV